MPDDEMKVTIMPATVRQVDDPRPSTATWTLIGDPPPGACSQCFVVHAPEEPHNQQSLQYQYRFYAEHDRWPTWEDALAHCSDELYEAWRIGLREHGVEVKPRDK